VNSDSATAVDCADEEGDGEEDVEERVEAEHVEEVVDEGDGGDEEEVVDEGEELEELEGLEEDEVDTDEGRVGGVLLLSSARGRRVRPRSSQCTRANSKRLSVANGRAFTRRSHTNAVEVGCKEVSHCDGEEDRDAATCVVASTGALVVRVAATEVV
jgi:hypothetical protein